MDKKDASEVDYTSAIRRAYYSLYHESLRFLLERYKENMISSIIDYKIYFEKDYSFIHQLGKLYQSDYCHIPRLHVNLHQIIAKIIITINKKYGRDFKTYRKKRNNADYDQSSAISYDDARGIVESIGSLIDSIKKL